MDDTSEKYPDPATIAKRHPPTSDWWEIRDGAVHLKRMPVEGETLPEVEITPTRSGQVGGGWVLRVCGPNGEQLTYGHGTE